MGAAGDSGVEGDPTGVAPHDFDDHDAVMGFGGGVDAVDGVGCDVDGGVKAEGDVGGGEVVVDGFGDADDGQSFLRQFEADLLRAIASDDDEGVHAQGFGVVDDIIGEVAHGLVPVIVDAIGEGIAAVGGSEDGSAARQNAADVVELEGTAFFRPDESVKAIANADDLVAILVDGGFNRGADDRVEAGAVSPTGADANFSDFSHLRPSSCGDWPTAVAAIVYQRKRDDATGKQNPASPQTKRRTWDTLVSFWAGKGAVNGLNDGEGAGGLAQAA